MTFTAVTVALALVVAFAVLVHQGSVPALETRVADMRYLDPVDGAIAITRSRLSRGEITAEDFERIVSVLRD